MLTWLCYLLSKLSHAKIWRIALHVYSLCVYIYIYIYIYGDCLVLQCWEMALGGGMKGRHEGGGEGYSHSPTPVSPT